MNVHFKQIVLSIVASCLFAACQDTDVPAVQGNEETSRAENTVTTYLRVNLNTVGESSSRGESDGYTNGTTTNNPGNIDEYTVNKVDFYFFDKNGNPYSIKENGSNIYTYSNLTGTETTPDGNNVESTWTPVMTLNLKKEDVDENGYPALMMAVVNSDQIYSGKTLEKIEAEVVSTPMNDTNVLMTSSSFYDANETYNSNTYPYAVNISEKFQDSYSKAMEKMIDVYVERLAAKVRLGIDFTDKTKINDDVVTIENIRDQSGKKVTAEIKLYAWGLNATAKKSLLMKQIDNTDNWKFTWGKNNSWNNVTDHRSYWGKSLNYIYNNEAYANSGSKGGFDLENGGDVNAEHNENDKIVLNYRSLNDYYNSEKSELGNYGSALNNDQYTLEHTPSKDHLQNMYKKDGQACVTSAILIAQLTKLGNKDVTKEILYRMNGLFYTEEDLIEYLYSLYLNNDNVVINDKTILGPNAWVIENNDIKEGDITSTVDEVTYKQIDASYFTLGDIGDGLVGLVVADKTATMLTKGRIYVYYGGKMYEYTHVDIGAGYLPNQLIEGFYDDLRQHNEDYVIPLNINGFKNGWMYYQIPIEHLAPFPDDIKYNNVGYSDNAAEGQYGVLRNHWYQITVRSISELGWGIFDPAELIVPQPRNEYIGLSFEMQVCPWHVKEYNITLDGTGN